MSGVPFSDNFYYNVLLVLEYENSIEEILALYREYSVLISCCPPNVLNVKVKFPVAGLVVYCGPNVSPVRREDSLS